MPLSITGNNGLLVSGEGKLKKKKKATKVKSTKKHKKSQADPKNVPKKSPKVQEKKQTPAKRTKTIRNRKPLPDMSDDIDYSNVSPVKVSDLSSDDLKVTFMSKSDVIDKGDQYVDLTTGIFQSTSTPEEAKVSKRRSPRLLRQGEVEITQQSPVSKRSLSFKKESRSVSEHDDKTDGLPDLMSEQNEVKKGEETASGASFEKNPQYLGTMNDEMQMRVARLESLLSTCEIERREDNKNRREAEYGRTEIHQRTLDLLGRITSDRETMIQILRNTVDNQRDILKSELWFSST